MATIVPYTFEKKEEKVIYFTSFVKGMKVLIATEKPFAAAAGNGIVEILEGAGHTVTRLEKYKEKSELLDAVAILMHLLCVVIRLRQMSSLLLQI